MSGKGSKKSLEKSLSKHSSKTKCICISSLFHPLSVFNLLLLFISLFSFTPSRKMSPTIFAKLNFNSLISLISLNLILEGSFNQINQGKGTFFFFVNAQYRSDTKMYKATIIEGMDTLVDHLEHLPDLVDTYDPISKQIQTEFYQVSLPKSEDYKLSIIVDPCKGQVDEICCDNKYGSPEYPRYIEPDWSYPYRISARYTMDDTYIMDNIQMVTEDGVKLEKRNYRRADDSVSIDEECEDYGVPYEACSGYRKRQTKFNFDPICKDNNQSVNALNSCWIKDPITGQAVQNEYCLQLAYAQTAYAFMCGNDFAEDDRCGTYIEVHLPTGSNYFTREYKINEKRIDQRNSSGYITTYISTEFNAISEDPKAGPKQVLCNFFEQEIRINQTVIILDNSERCCCPLVTYQCPKFEYNEGYTAAAVETLEQKLYLADNYEVEPYCYDWPSDKDYIMCEDQDTESGRMYYFQCDKVNTTSFNTTSTNQNYTSDDLDYKAYKGTCSFFEECAAALFDTDSSYHCGGTDQIFSFIGMTGTVVSVPDPKLPKKDGLYGVTFNNNRTIYYFGWDQVAQDASDHNYELWWVQRTRSNYIVQQKKAFKVSEPPCTYDNLRNEYLPYAIIDHEGNVVDNVGEVATIEDDEWRLNDFIDNPNNKKYYG